ncbi:hypothetical protein V2H45_08590 [Tumidithrix elongata RA019]|uniref:Uncharacterized protein n=1 Tax=Tumidithrix elongata BACA0141 TaxID=2716417 RepID=A0AAW9PVP7_9CYAN|nr:hypothetical protein [Tumidithrix elongata RA019]
MAPINPTAKSDANASIGGIGLTQSPKIRFLFDIGIILGATLAQCLWMCQFTSVKVGLVNLLPTALFLAIWYFCVKVVANPKYFWLCFGLGFVLTLRLPITLTKFLEPIDWTIYLAMTGLVLRKIFDYFKAKQSLVFAIAAIAIVGFNAIGHLSLNSPFTYSFRTIHHVASNFTPGVENNQSWECPYEMPNLAVSCDMRHFISPERIFTEPNYDASFSVFMSRFFYGYVSSLVGVEGHRWFASFSLNLFLWFGACAALFRTCILTGLDRRIALTAMLCCASGWEFVSFVGQPSPQLTAYAFAAIAIWATVEIIHINQPEAIAPEESSIEKNLTASQVLDSETALGQKNALITLLALIIISGGLAYEIYPLTLVSAILLIVYRQRFLAIAIAATQICLVILWKEVSLAKFLGTLGNVESQSSGIKNLTYSLQTWLDIFWKFDWYKGFYFIAKGMQSYIYGSYIVGAIATLIFVVYLIRKQLKQPDRSHRLLLSICLSLTTVMLLATIFTTPQAHIWSGTGMQPRLAAFVYPVNIIAIAAIANWLLKQYTYAIAVGTFYISNLDLTGLASMSQIFDYGAIGLYWK